MAKPKPAPKATKSATTAKATAARDDGEQPKAGSGETRSERLITMMRSRQGATGQELASAVGWQVHSVRGFISGTLKKRDDLEVSAAKIDGLTRYRVRTRKGAAA
jgi:hypothetical protein